VALKTLSKADWTSIRQTRKCVDQFSSQQLLHAGGCRWPQHRLSIILRRWRDGLFTLDRPGQLREVATARAQFKKRSSLRRHAIEKPAASEVLL
jgi:hypothetical protein